MDPYPVHLPTDRSLISSFWWVKATIRSNKADFPWLDGEQAKEPGLCDSPEGKQAALSRVLSNTDVHVQVVALVMATGCGKHGRSLMHIKRRHAVRFHNLSHISCLNKALPTHV